MSEEEEYPVEELEEAVKKAEKKPRPMPSGIAKAFKSPSQRNRIL